MIRSLYNSAASLQVLNRQHELIADNLANVNTAGHRRAEFSVSERSGKQRVRDNFGFGPQVDRTHTDFSQGRLIETGRSLDAAIDGDAFFVLQAPGGESYYTRSGQFFRDMQSGELRGVHNLPISGQGGPIQIGSDIADSEINISRDGKIFAGGREVGELALAAFENNQTLIPVSQSVFRASPQTVTREPEAQITHKFHELSNVNPTSELIGLIIGGRQYEAIQKATKTISESLEQSIQA